MWKSAKQNLETINKELYISTKKMDPNEKIPELELKLQYLIKLAEEVLQELQQISLEINQNK